MNYGRNNSINGDFEAFVQKFGSLGSTILILLRKSNHEATYPIPHFLIHKLHLDTFPYPRRAEV